MSARPADVLHYLHGDWLYVLHLAVGRPSGNLAVDQKKIIHIGLFYERRCHDACPPWVLISESSYGWLIQMMFQNHRTRERAIKTPSSLELPSSSPL